MADDPTPDWRLLAPHRPLSPGDDAYVSRPTSGGDAIAMWVAAGGSTVLVSGPTGVGKSTELAHAAQALMSTRVACLVQADRKANIHRLTADSLMHLIAVGVVELARGPLQLSISQELATMADAVTSFPEMHPPSKPFRTSGLTAARLAVQEVERVSQQGRVALLIDGLEKLSSRQSTDEILDAFSQLPESVDLVVVIPWHVALGGGTEPVIRVGEHLHRVPALEVTGADGDAAARFLERVLAQRLWHTDTAPAELKPLLSLAFQASGGIPRVFLQLISDAGTYARVKRASSWPDNSDLRDAIEDQKDSFRRALLPGDTDAIQRVWGSDGRELDLERRIRLLAQGILLERFHDRAVFLDVHPLVAPAVGLSRP